MMMMFLIITLLLLLCDWYILVGVLGANAWWLKSLVLIPSVAYVVVMLLMLTTKDIRQGMLNLLFWLTLCIVIPTLLFTLLSLFVQRNRSGFPVSSKDSELDGSLDFRRLDRYIAIWDYVWMEKDSIPTPCSSGSADGLRQPGFIRNGADCMRKRAGNCMSVQVSART